MGEVLVGMVKQSLGNEKSGDYKDENGILHCCVCGDPKQKDIDFIGNIIRVGIFCRCMEAEDEKRKQEEEKAKLEKIRAEMIPDISYRSCRFDSDDGLDKGASFVARNYANAWADMYKENIGAVITGGIGSGKTFLACAIANHVIDCGYYVRIETLSGLLNRMQNAPFSDKNEILESIARFSLLVLDDIGCERDTSYADEQIYNIIDTRYRSKKPLIITTNLTLDEMKNSPDTMRRRVYDRIIELCPVCIVMDGPSRRSSVSASRYKKAFELMNKNMKK